MSGTAEQRRLWDAVEWADVPEPARAFIDCVEARAVAAESALAEERRYREIDEARAEHYRAKLAVTESALDEARRALQEIAASRDAPMGAQSKADGCYQVATKALRDLA